ncbi:uncharacterized protein VICG_02133 [Vittaforma corneae ATCC 50505]|uniref:Uncharacterized protein n=1 Tax=Vittaforma corneae (strain ATCC 50505) TaxID=993615 RepID=L2GJM0_VITCO|nr:uncharacterized protein VICG_02133 [Vittaforma corneae ATCC 50505]ELA40829.1 hypothetical protein VICG_02133 [Vittaforma corneae ATCC 50505]
MNILQTRKAYKAIYCLIAFVGATLFDILNVANPDLKGIQCPRYVFDYSDVPDYLYGYMDGSILIHKVHTAKEVAFYHMFSECIFNLKHTYDKINHFLRTNKSNITTLVGDEKWKEIVDTVETTRKNVLQAIQDEGKSIESTTFDMWKELYEFKDVKGNTTAEELAEVSRFTARGELKLHVDQESLQQADAKLMSIIDTKKNAILTSIRDAEEKIYALISSGINESSFLRIQC